MLFLVRSLWRIDFGRSQTYTLFYVYMHLYGLSFSLTLLFFFYVAEKSRAGFESPHMFSLCFGETRAKHSSFWFCSAVFSLLLFFLAIFLGRHLYLCSFKLFWRFVTRHLISGIHSRGRCKYSKREFHHKNERHKQYITINHHIVCITIKTNKREDWFLFRSTEVSVTTKWFSAI